MKKNVAINCLRRKEGKWNWKYVGNDGQRVREEKEKRMKGNKGGKTVKE